MPNLQTNSPVAPGNTAIATAGPASTNATVIISNSAVASAAPVQLLVCSVASTALAWTTLQPGQTINPSAIPLTAGQVLLLVTSGEGIAVTASTS